MPSVEKRLRTGQVRWYARYRDPSGKQRTKTFDRKIDAERYLASTSTAQQTGSWVDPKLSQVTVGVWGQPWVDAQVGRMKPSSHARLISDWRTYIAPRWGAVRLADVRTSAVQTWVADLAAGSAPRQSTARASRGRATEQRPLSSATVAKIVHHFRPVMAAAVADSLLARNPCDGVKLPRVTSAEQRYLSHGQVDQVAGQAGRYGTLLRFLAYTGVRWGEAIAVRVGRVDLDRRRVSIAEAVADDASGAQIIGTPKGHERREVPAPGFLVDLLRPLVEGRDPDQLLFTSPTGRMLSDRNVVREINLAALGAGVGVPGLKLHELRHTAASLAIDAGASVKVVQRMLGHKSAAMTLDLYGHLFDDRLDEVSDALDRAAREAGVYPMCTDRPHGPALDDENQSETGSD